MEKYKDAATDFSDVHVKLKPIFGIQPGIYLSVIYAVIIVLALFFVLIFPGLSNNGTIVTFTSIPDKAGIKVDDKYYGATPIQIFIKSGMRKISISKPFYKEIDLNEKVDGAIVASLFFPLKKNIANNLEIENPDGLVSSAISDYSTVGMIKDFTFDYQLPPIMSETAEVCYSKNGKSDQILEKMYNFLDNSMYFVDSEQELYDFVKAQIIVSSKGKILSPGSLINFVSNIIHVNNNYQSCIFWLLNALPQTLVKSEKQETNKYLLYKKIKQSKWFIDFEKKYFDRITSIPEVQSASGSSGSIYVGGAQHNRIPGGKLVMGDTGGLKEPDDLLRETFPHSVNVAPFYISATEVTNTDFYRFTQENSQWRPSNKKELLDKRLISDTYLRGWNNDKPEDGAMNLPVSQVSYFAASAYCVWLTKFAPSGLKVRLPFEAEWEYISKNDEQVAALAYPDKPKQAPLAASAGPSDKFGLKNMYGNLWTWCEDWFLPASYMLFNPEKDYFNNNIFTGSEKSLRGGSWANTKEDNLRSFTRGSLPPGFCTAYTGFRTVVSDR